MDHASIMPEPQRSALQVHLLHVDDDRHAAMRPLVAEPLSARRVERLRGSIRHHVHRIIDSLPDTASSADPVDVIATISSHLPLLVLAEAIGLPPALRAAFDPAWCTVVAPVAPGLPGRDAYQERLQALSAYIADIVTEVGNTLAGNNRPTDMRSDRSLSPLQRTIAACERGQITTAERDSIIFQLLVAGQDPVNAQLQLMLLSLFAQPPALAEVTASALAGADISRAVEELLRFDGAFNLATWRFLADTDGLHGVNVPAGDSVIVALGAANHDPDMFPDPTHLNLSRTPNPHLTFGHGPHTCPGAALARITLQETLSALLRRLPGLSLACPPEELTWSPAPLTRAVERLPVTYLHRLPESSDQRELTTAHSVMEILFAHARWITPNTPDTSTFQPQPAAADSPIQLNGILRFIHRREPISFTLPGFPCKSPNPKKVAGRLPDEGERRALHELNALCDAIAEVYSPGAEVTIYSDGHVFTDVIGVDDEDISAYGTALRQLITSEELPHLSVVDLSDLWGEIPFDLKRDRLDAEWSGSLDQLRTEARTEGETARVLCGMTRFMLDDAVDLPTGRSARQRMAKQRAYRVLARSKAWGEVVKKHRPHGIRLSIHPQPRGAEKFGISLIKPDLQWVTPWHSVVLRRASGTISLLRHDEARKHGIPVRRDGTPTVNGESPWYFQEVAPTHPQP